MKREKIDKIVKAIESIPDCQTLYQFKADLLQETQEQLTQIAEQAADALLMSNPATFVLNYTAKMARLNAQLVQLHGETLLAVSEIVNALEKKTGSLNCQVGDKSAFDYIKKL